MCTNKILRAKKKNHALGKSLSTPVIALRILPFPLFSVVTEPEDYKY